MVRILSITRANMVGLRLCMMPVSETVQCLFSLFSPLSQVGCMFFQCFFLYILLFFTGQGQHMTKEISGTTG